MLTLRIEMQHLNRLNQQYPTEEHFFSHHKKNTASFYFIPISHNFISIFVQLNTIYNKKLLKMLTMALLMNN